MASWSNNTESSVPTTDRSKVALPNHLKPVPLDVEKLAGETALNGLYPNVRFLSPDKTKQLAPPKRRELIQG
jgi:hypothetical protein